MTQLEKLFKKYMREHTEGKAHAVLAASSSERWLGCPASVSLSKGQPNIEHASAQIGTNTHTLLQFMLENPTWPQFLFKDRAAKKFLNHIGYTPEMREAVRVAERFVMNERLRLSMRAKADPELHIERKVTLEGVGHGTADVILFQPFGTLHVIDYKNGKYKVEPEDNTQGLYYAVAAADEFGWDFRECHITIIQPNFQHPRGPVRTWKTTPERLEKAKLMFTRGAAATKKKNPAVVPNHKYCWFCPARLKNCPAQMQVKEEKIIGRFQRG